MKTKKGKSNKSDQKGFEPPKYFLTPEFVLLSKQLLWSNQKTISLIDVVEVIEAGAFPFDVDHLWMVASFLRNPSVSYEDFYNEDIEHKVVIANPEGKEIDLGSYPARIDESDSPLYYRLCIDFSEGLRLTSPGVYSFMIFEKSKNHESKKIMEKPFLLIPKTAEK